ncbi:flagellar hook-basal body protein FliE [Loktanella sp. 3ANDIMAR09]|uniref:flagellar hook-basal body complex protein FliE n=1 Tax=Loktanella sp. 3ANDIMAR09 TaxID=1225657 RepID=UPI0006F51991|nr:flagellar hook-basal body complex protein FliE [Loktanella sp. 3ANDIMAR09]KQI69937.1 flagellar hook-basal body protein FliE [Loktanella sp. 3ANDIMAR09]
MDIRSAIVAQNYASNLAATKPEPNAATAVAGAAQDFMATLNASEAAALQSMSGAGDPHTLVQALAQTELAVQTAVTVRDKVVEAYQEILRMPI